MGRTKPLAEAVASEWMERLMAMTTESALLLVGTVQTRTKVAGTNARGSWEMFKVEVRGIEGRCLYATANDPARVPEKGQPIILPVYVGQKGSLHEARNLGEAF